jgi:hypothetical protein
MNEDTLEKIINSYLENNSLEELFEEFDLTPLEALTSLYENGMISDDDLERLIPADG